MGTNYYVVRKECKCCGHLPLKEHIGRSSIGWAFMLHVNDKHKNLEEWMDYLCKLDIEGAAIQDTYGRNITYKEMMDIITNRPAREDNSLFNMISVGEAMYCTYDEKTKLMRQKPGPNITWGPGTWDCVDEVFS